MRVESNNGQVGILEPLWRLLDDILAVAQNRIELFRAEAQEEKVRLVELLLLASAVIVLTTVGLTLGICAVIVAVGVEHRVMALIACAAICGTGAGLIGRALRRRLDSEVFASFAEELRKHRQCILHR
ncbi:MAG TPA: phage holin family protein [Verrucomicrobiae bacterium]|nr:phage holin family protein [Verrucomicrobiae bacterium]